MLSNFIRYVITKITLVSLLTLIQNARSGLLFVFDIWMLEIGQLCLIFICKGQFLLKKFIQGHKGQKGQWRPKKAIKGQTLKKSLFSSIFHVKSSINWKVLLWKSCFSKIGNFHFHIIKFLKLHFVKNIKIAGFCW